LRHLPTATPRVLLAALKNVLQQRLYASL
jgi:hypothetical protein